MSSKISKQMIIRELNHIPDEKNKEVMNLLQHYKTRAEKKASKITFKEFLKQAPTLSETDLNDISNARIWMTEWMTRKS